MNCSNCGKNEVSFTYTSNINGKVTKKQLCAECARQLGYADSFGSMFSRTERMMSRMMDGFFGSSLKPFTAFGLPVTEFFGLPGWEAEAAEANPMPAGTASAPQAEKAEGEGLDPELSRRREINALRHQMGRAAAKEDYETAAKLRDEIRRLEG
ncbi:MAG: UvrB/UvrC motif-containing protein [Oscillospiraceae bacterium]|nr:UvrB/UvrC motif-containing protein [Oscillospiraceae bacterium]